MNLNYKLWQLTGRCSRRSPRNEADFTERDLLFFYELLSPKSIRPLAEKLGNGSMVLGAQLAYKVVREKVKNYARYIRYRDQLPNIQSLKLASNLRYMGYVGNFQPVYPLQSGGIWRDTACEIFGGNGIIPGWFSIEVGNRRTSEVQRAVIIAASSMLVDKPHLNRAVLNNSVYRRTDGHVMIHVDLGHEQVRSVILDAAHLEYQRDLKKPLIKAVRSAVEADNHPLKVIADKLLQEWLKAGFIGSPAGVMISPVGEVGVHQGWAALVPGNGVPIAVTVGKVRDNGMCNICCAIDHRAFDGRHAGEIYEYLELKILEVLGNDENTNLRR